MKKMVMGLLVGVLIFGMGLTAQADIVDLYSVSDAEITGWQTGSPANTSNWGSLTWLAGNVNQTGGPVTTNPPPEGKVYFPSSQSNADSRGLFQFDLSSIPAGATINSATVSIYIGFNAFSPVGSRLTSVQLYQVTSNWTETGVTYDTRPTWNTTQVTSMSIPPGSGSGGSVPFNGYINGSITNLVQGWFNGTITNNGLATSDTGTTAGLLRIYAHEATGTTLDPRLRVDYTPAPVPIPAAVWLLGSGLLGLVGLRRRFKK